MLRPIVLRRESRGAVLRVVRPPVHLELVACQRMSRVLAGMGATLRRFTLVLESE